MKTLNKYTVNGGLFTGDGVTPVTVADQVKLYLDTEAHPGFPEFIVGVVQHPVAPLNGGSVISYSFEYDEADLLGEVAHLIVADVVSVEFQNAGGELTTETLLDTVADLTSPEQATFRAEIGVNAENVLALLDDSALEVASISLTDGTGTALAAGSLSLNAAGKVVVHDNDSNAEDLPHLVNSLESINFATRLLAATMNNVSYTKKLADILLPASALTNGKQLHLIGRIFTSWAPGAKPDDQSYLVLCKEGQNPKTEGYLFLIALAVTAENVAFHLPMKFTVAASTWTMANQGTIKNAFMQRSSGASVSHHTEWEIDVDWLVQTAITGPAGEPVKLELHIWTNDTSNTVATELMISGNLSAISE